MRLVRSILLVAGASFALAGCIDEKIVFRDRELFNAPPDASSGFLGYYDVANGQTTCGNCHGSKQAAWAETKHSHAWADLQESGQAQASCEPCHTVNEQGNLLAVAAGFNVVKDSAYRDVQCEACHGPGAVHVQNPEANTKPLPSIAVDTGLTNGCGECHSGSHNPFVEEWSKSAHGYGGGRLFRNYYASAPCKNCHEGREALRVNFEGFDPRLSTSIGGPPGVYLEATIAGAAGAQPQVCAVCHDPHDATEEAQLRGSHDEPEETQVCVMCHRREAHAFSGGALRRGPHAAQGLINIDEDVGWKPPTWPYERLLPTHAGKCASCHMAMFDINDAAGKFVKRYTGHLFEPIPCIDQTTGEPVPHGTCAEDQRYFGGCAVSGCHGSAAAARTAFGVLEGRMNYLTDQLWADTDADGVLETTDGGVLPKVLAQAVAAPNLNVMNLYDTSLTAAEGAIWNAQLAATDDRAYWFNFKIQGQNSCDPNSTSASTRCPGTLRSNTAHHSGGGGLHNPFLLEALLIESVKAMKTTYGVSPSQPIELAPQMARPPGVRTAVR